ncbi:HlyD family type I secretion periplasmic adaptor subunit [Sandarakinorhabdus sp. DWP1-3-1]|uniref:HlyD family type I secretion periplasmic adaptor subunit n=1 Tax=Sandarakinorhabdus sp. DWP1-3-1 TaxID=2804627 RepID=UPI003CE92AE1
MSLATTIEAAAQPLAPSRAAGLMLWTIAGLTGSLLGWAALARVDETATAMGRIIPSRQLQVVSNLEGGTVETILVRPGQRVAAGQPLLRLATTQFAAEYGRTSTSSRALAARAARLEAEIAGRAPTFPPALAADAPEVIAVERALHAARATELSAATAMATARLDQAQRALAQAEVEARARAQAARSADSEVAMIAPLVDKGIEPQIALVRARAVQDEARGGAAAAAVAVQRARAAVTEARSGLHGVRDKFRADALGELTTTRAELGGQAAMLPALQDRVRRADVRAPVAGTVNRVLVATPGGTVRAGDPLVEIVPVDDALVVEAEVRPADIAFVHPGQQATVKITAYDYTIYGALDGVVERLSPDATVDQRSGESHYTIRVRTRQPGLRAPDGSLLPIQAGMIASVDLLGRKRSVLSYLATPVARVGGNAFRDR